MCRQQWPQPFRPLDQGHARGERVLDTQLEGVLGQCDAKQIKMPKRHRPGTTRLVDLNKRERRAGNLFVGAAIGADEGPCQGRLAGTQVATQRNDVTHLHKRGQSRGIGGRFAFIHQQAVTKHPNGA